MSLDTSDLNLAFSHVVLVATSDDLFQKTVEFYQSFGFSTVRLTTHDVPRRDIAHSNTVISEAWLHLFASRPENNVTLRIIHCGGSDGKSAAADEICSAIRICLATPEIENAKQILKGNSAKFTTHLNPETNDDRIATHDPLGNEVFFISQPNTFSIPSSPEVRPTHGGNATPPTEFALSGDPAKRKSIGILTSGGDAQGMNPCVRAVVRMAIARNCRPFLIYEGYQGLVDGGDKIKESSWTDVSGFLTLGGTMIGTARCKEFRELEGRRKGVYNLIKHGIDALVVIGGDGSLTGADRLRAEWPDHVQQLEKDGQISTLEANKYRTLMIVGMVGSIDNDLASTDMTIGACSALERICESVDAILSTAMSHQRAFVVEVMGRHCGWLALNAAISTGADYLFIPEAPPSRDDWETYMCKTLKASRDAGKRTSLVIMAEGALDKNLNPIKADYIKDILSTRLGYDTRVTILGHVQRGGAPAHFDRFLGTMQGAEAVEAILRATPDTPSPVIGMLENKITTQPLKEAIELTGQVAQAIENKDFSRAMELRSQSFSKQLKSYKEIASYNPESKMKLPEDKRLRIAILHAGAPAGGMNTATRSAVRLCINRGHTPLGVHNGFPGLMRGEITELDWLTVDGWTITGGSKLGTNRDQPTPQLGAVAYQLQKHNIQALMVIGGFEAYTAVLALARNRSQYPAFNIPIALIPATVSNNVPGTEFSLGSDTAANVIVQATDMIKLSASSNRKRIFVIEVQGGNCGFLAVMAGISGGSTTVYTPEEGVDLTRLQRDIAHLRSRYIKELGRSEGRVTLCNEKASKIYSTDMIANIYEAESGGFYGARTAVLGHLQQGGTPSPLDRCRANTMAIESINWLQAKCWESMEVPNEDNIRLPADKLKRKYFPRIFTNRRDTVGLLGVIGSELRFTPVEDLVQHTNFDRRVPRKIWWHATRQLIDILSGVGVDIENGGSTTQYKSCAIDLTAEDLMRLYGRQDRRLSKLTTALD
ncbi:6-phosphofructokinase, alpha subunit [Coemansia sp. RSA 1813]|nr:6-phosphofructokinase, alpha subunit [Coemansia sp. RSA 1646]KAJ1773035.1 6-phosphofructokinase, alpha subunit [Coemansia sp. RSA 1843]KAJ2092189.1 6-phosphofructokinase, alpha subunit [Coemansia sp. RSA 986]KAJ2215325.1 6-phosphofructokinase, alpha subunit [Coemansia sp. RSA 487]KAJ2570338.1 6-phosphofructokinase, alpha subunit [Coemansia sp. RSA 1813]